MISALKIALNECLTEHRPVTLISFCFGAIFVTQEEGDDHA